MTGTVAVATAPPPENPKATLPVLFGASTVLAGLGVFSLRRRQSALRRFVRVIMGHRRGSRCW
jgi:hypothetical protein